MEEEDLPAFVVWSVFELACGKLSSVYCLFISRGEVRL